MLGRHEDLAVGRNRHPYAEAVGVHFAIVIGQATGERELLGLVLLCSREEALDCSCVAWAFGTCVVRACAAAPGQVLSHYADYDVESVTNTCESRGSCLERG